jgi:hypothetical protein
VLLGGETTLGPRGVLLGQFDWETHSPLSATVQSKRVQVLSADLGMLRCVHGITVTPTSTRVTLEDLVWICKLSDSCLEKVLSFYSTCDPKAKSYPEHTKYNPYGSVPRKKPETVEGERPVFACNECTATYANILALTNHKRQTHQYVNPERDFIKKPECPACGMTFSVIKTARNHFERRVCIESKSFKIPSCTRAQVDDLRDLFAKQSATVAAAAASNQGSECQ